MVSYANLEDVWNNYSSCHQVKQHRSFEHPSKSSWHPYSDVSKQPLHTSPSKPTIETFMNETDVQDDGIPPQKKQPIEVPSTLDDLPEHIKRQIIKLVSVSNRVVSSTIQLVLACLIALVVLDMWT